MNHDGIGLGPRDGVWDWTRWDVSKKSAGAAKHKNLTNWFASLLFGIAVVVIYVYAL